jgi:hypothetical protein
MSLSDILHVLFHPTFAQKLNEPAFDVRLCHIGSVFRRKDQVYEKANEGLGHGVGGTLSESDQFFLSDRLRALPTAKYCFS